MKITDHIKNANGKTLFSFELLPPVKGQSIQWIYDAIDPLMEFKPSWINVTYHRAEQVFKKKADGTFEKVEIRKRPGTVGICAALQNHYDIDAVPHLICGGFSKRETEDALIDLNFIGVQNVLVLRGDAAKNEANFEPHPDGNRLAIDLLKQTINLNHGIYLEEDIRDGFRTDFCAGVAGYPEKHFETPNLEIEMQRLKDKVDAGAEYIMTQMFFDNSKFFAFVKQCRDNGIDVPIIPGLKPLTSKKQLSVIPRTFHVDIPTELSNEIMRAKTVFFDILRRLHSKQFYKLLAEITLIFYTNLRANLCDINAFSKHNYCGSSDSDRSDKTVYSLPGNCFNLFIKAGMAHAHCSRETF